jgi:hypothetical protein
VIYLADQNVNDAQELFAVRMSGGSAIPLSKPLPPLGMIDRFDISPDSKVVVYRADQETFDQFELFAAYDDGVLPTAVPTSTGTPSPTATPTATTTPTATQVPGEDAGVYLPLILK